MIMNLTLIHYKELVIKTIREYFYNQGFHEVFVPILQQTIVVEPNIYPFTTTWATSNNKQALFLPTSPEAACVNYLAAGGGNCFAIAPAFRNHENTSPIHTPEFLMLEWYREQSDYKNIMDEVQSLVLHIASFPFPELKMSQFREWSTTPWKTLSLIDLFQQHIGISLPDYLGDKKMKSLAKQKGYTIKGASWEQLFHQLFLNEIEPKLGTDPYFLIDYPSKISPLCQPKKDNPNFCERFELFINEIEIANGNTQNTNSAFIQKVFIQEAKKRKLNKKFIDESFLQTTESIKTKGVCGVGLGLDRLLMLLTGASDIHTLNNPNQPLMPLKQTPTPLDTRLRK